MITWREPGFNTVEREGHDSYESLPEWALEAHEDDPRPWLYELDELERARTS